MWSVTITTSRFLSDNSTTWITSELTSVDYLSPSIIWGCKLDILTVMLCRLWVCYNPLENFALTQEPISLMSPAHKPHSPSVASGCTPSSVIKSSLCCSGSFPCTCHLEVSPQPALVYPEPGSLSPTLSSPGPLHFLELGSSVKSSSCPKDRVLPEFWFGVAMWFCNWGHPRQKEKGKWNGNTLPTQVTAASLNLPSQSTCFGSLCRGLRELPFFFF